jgi:hypothetical protein
MSRCQFLGHFPRSQSIFLLLSGILLLFFALRGKRHYSLERRMHSARMMVLSSNDAEYGFPTQ